MFCGLTCGCSKSVCQLDLLPLSQLPDLSSLHLSNVVIGGNLDLFRPIHLTSLGLLGGGVATVNIPALRRMVRALLARGALQQLVLAIPGSSKQLCFASGQQVSLLNSLLMSFPTDIWPALTPAQLGGLKVLALLGAQEPLGCSMTALHQLEALSVAGCQQCDAQMLGTLNTIR